MAVYLCCKAGCGNTLRPEGPINALIAHSAGHFNMDISLKEDAKIDNDSLNTMLGTIPIRGYAQELSVSSQDPIPGEKGHFTLRELKIQVPTDRAVSKITQTITICCSVCNTCCDYPKK